MPPWPRQRFSRSLRFFRDLFFEKGQIVCLDVGMRGCEPFGPVNFADLSLDSGGVSESAEELVGGEVGEPDAVHAATFAEHVFTGVKRKHGVADPCSFAFDFQGLVACHARSLWLRVWVREPFQVLASDSLPQAIL